MDIPIQVSYQPNNFEGRLSAKRPWCGSTNLGAGETLADSPKGSALMQMVYIYIYIFPSLRKKHVKSASPMPKKTTLSITVEGKRPLKD